MKEAFCVCCLYSACFFWGSFLGVSEKVVAVCSIATGFG